MPSNSRASLSKLTERMKNYPAKVWFRALLLLLSFILLILIFAPNPIKLKDELKLERPTDAQTQQTAGSPTDSVLTGIEKLIEAQHDKANIEKLIETQHDKANDEIKMLQEQIDTWFHYKFILIGGMVALFLGHFGIFGKQNTTSPKTSEKILVATLMSNRTSVLLALVCIVAFVIDMHIRAHLTNMQGLGHWIYNYVEPAYFRAAGAKTGHIPREGLVRTQFFPWETFIHTNTRQVQQTNPLYRTMYSLQLHFMTIAIYMLYLVVFQNVCLLCKKGKQQQVAFLGFVMVHIAILAFIIVAHTIPNSFDVRCFPISSRDCWVTGSQGSSYYLIAWLSLLIFSLPYLYLLFPSLQSSKKSTCAAP